MKKYWLGALLLASMPTWAVLPWGATPSEQAMCQAMVYSRLDRSDPNSMHMHHYCDGLRFLNRAYASMSNKQDMSFYLKESIGGFDYILRSTQESYAFRGDSHLGRARALKLQGRKAEAVGELYKALSFKHVSAEAYRSLADHYRDAGNKQKSLEMATKGLRLNPDSKGLKRRYTELGGKLPLPVMPYETMPAEEAKTEIKSEARLEVAPSPKETADQITGTTVSASPAEPPPLIEQPKIGTPNNPYCRFCPD